MKTKLKEEVIKLRKKGFSYNQILQKVPVAKSTISLWLRSVGLAKPQYQKLTQKRIEAMKRGWEACRRKRINKEKIIKENALKDIIQAKLNISHLWIMGIMLYWAEGAKSKEYRVSQRISFSNQDPLMIKLFILWLRKCLKIEIERIRFDIYIHENSKNKLKTVIQHWAKVTGFFEGKFDKIYFKKHKIHSKRHNNGDNYFGLLRVRVTKSTDLYRKIIGWTEGICRNCGVV